jgi:hypothetical protein
MDHPRPGLKYVPVKDLDRSKTSFADFTVADPAQEKLGKGVGALPYTHMVARELLQGAAANR